MCLDEIKGTADQSDSTDSEHSQRGADIEDLRKYGDRAASQGYVPPPDVVAQVGGVTSKVAGGVTRKVVVGVTSKVAGEVCSEVIDRRVVGEMCSPSGIPQIK